MSQPSIVHPSAPVNSTRSGAAMYFDDRRSSFKQLVLRIGPATSPTKRFPGSVAVATIAAKRRRESSSDQETS